MRYQLTKNFVMRRILDEVILVPVSPEARQQNNLLVLNPLGAQVVEGVRAGLSAHEIQQQALDEFEAEEAQITSDVDRFLSELHTLGVIHVARD